jgi:diguanylate cyclase (GGDEF)-like protein
MDSLPAPVVATDSAGRLALVNPAASDLLRRPPSSLRGVPLVDVLELVDERHQALDVHALLVRVLEDGVNLRVHHATVIQPGGNEVAVSCSASPLRGPTGEVRGCVWLFYDVREERQLRHHLSVQARQDPLTGLVNRQEFERRLVRAAASSARNGGEHALCFLDLDRFKAINDRYGHAAGDSLLTEIAGLLLSRIRGRDTLARLGGDEFALLLEHCPLEEAQRVGEGMVETVRAHRFSWQGQALSVGLSVGVTPIRPDGPDAPGLLRAADQACYRAKQEGRDRVCVAGP